MVRHGKLRLLLLYAAVVVAVPTSSRDEATRRAGVHAAHGRSRFKMGNFVEATAHFTAAVGLDAARSDLWNNLGSAQYHDGRLLDAAFSFGRAAEVAHVDDTEVRATALARRGAVLVAAGGAERLEEALAAYRQSARVDPVQPDVHHNVGTALFGLGRYDEAASAFERLVELDPRRADAHFNLAQARHRAGGLGGTGGATRSTARTSSTSTADSTGNTDSSGSGHTRTSSSTRSSQQALRSLERAISIDRKHADAWLMRGLILAKLQRQEEAAEAYEEGLRLRPDDVDGLVNYGSTLADLGDEDEATASYGQAIRLNPQHAVAWSNMAAVFTDAGRDEEAKHAYSTFIELSTTTTEGAEGKGAGGEQKRKEQATANIDAKPQTMEGVEERRAEDEKKRKEQATAAKPQTGTTLAAQRAHSELVIRANERPGKRRAALMPTATELENDLHPSSPTVSLATTSPSAPIWRTSTPCAFKPSNPTATTPCGRVIRDRFISEKERDDVVRAIENSMADRPHQGGATRIPSDPAQRGFVPFDTPDTRPDLVKEVTRRIRESIQSDFGVRATLFDSGGTLTRLRPSPPPPSTRTQSDHDDDEALSLPRGNDSNATNVSSSRDLDPSFVYWHSHVDIPSDYVHDTLNIASYDYSALLYLSTHGDDFEGGKLAFVDADADRIVRPVRGRLVTFSAGAENLHRVERVTEGTRYVFALWFTSSCASPGKAVGSSCAGGQPRQR